MKSQYLPAPFRVIVGFNILLALASFRFSPHLTGLATDYFGRAIILLPFYIGFLLFLRREGGI